MNQYPDRTLRTSLRWSDLPHLTRVNPRRPVRSASPSPAARRACESAAPRLSGELFGQERARRAAQPMGGACLAPRGGCLRSTITFCIYLRPFPPAEPHIIRVRLARMSVGEHPGGDEGGNTPRRKAALGFASTSRAAWGEPWCAGGAPGRSLHGGSPASADTLADADVSTGPTRWWWWRLRSTRIRSRLPGAAGGHGENWSLHRRPPTRLGARPRLQPVRVTATRASRPAPASAPGSASRRLWPRCMSRRGPDRGGDDARPPPARWAHRCRPLPRSSGHVWLARRRRRGCGPTRQSPCAGPLRVRGVDQSAASQYAPRRSMICVFGRRRAAGTTHRNVAGSWGAPEAVVSAIGSVALSNPPRRRRQEAVLLHGPGSELCRAAHAHRLCSVALFGVLVASLITTLSTAGDCAPSPFNSPFQVGARVPPGSPSCSGRSAATSG